MNHEEAAEKIKTAIGAWLRGNAYLVRATGDGCVEFDKVLAAKLTELYGEVPKDLEAAVREAVLGFRDKLQVKCTKQNHRLYSKFWGDDQHNQCTYRILGFGPLIEHIVSAVAPLLAERDEWIEELEEKITHWYDKLMPILEGMAITIPPESPDD